MPKSKYGEKVLKQAKEKVEVKRRLRKKYPQMYKEGWGKTKDKPNWAQQLKGKVKELLGKKTVRTGAVEGGLKKAGLTKQEISRFKSK